MRETEGKVKSTLGCPTSHIANILCNIHPCIASHHIVSRKWRIQAELQILSQFLAWIRHQSAGMGHPPTSITKGVEMAPPWDITE